MKTMRFIVAMLLLGMTISVAAQGEKQWMKDAKKEEKRLKKEGWQITPGSIPMLQQIYNSYKLRNEMGMDLAPKYVFGNAQSLGQFIDAAKVAADGVSKADLVGQISPEITRLVSEQISTKQLSNDQAESVMGVVEKSKSIVTQKLGIITPVIQFYRKLPNGNYEVMMSIAYDREKITNISKETVNGMMKEAGLDIEVMQ